MAATPGVSPAKSVETAVRRRQAVRMRLDGKPWHEIEKALGYASPGAAHTDVKRALEESRKELALVADEYRELELQRLDDMERATRTVLDALHVTVSHGRIIRNDDGSELLDHDPALRAVDRLLRIAERRSRLLGLDQPVKHEISGQVLYAVEGVNVEKLM